MGGWTDGWAGCAGWKDVKEESGRVEAGDQEVEGKFSVKVFANKGITMQRSLCAALRPLLLLLQPPLSLSLTPSILFPLQPFSPFPPPSAFTADLGSHLAPVSPSLMAFLPLSVTLFIFCLIPVFFISPPLLPPPSPHHPSSPIPLSLILFFSQSSSRPGAVVCCSKTSLSAHPCSSRV